MLHNRFAGDALKKVDQLYEAGITMNGQIVLCKGVNDGAELEYSIAGNGEICTGSSECVRCSGRSDEISVTGCIRWSHLQKKMRSRCWSRSTAGRKSFVTKYRNPFYPCQSMNGIFWQRRRFRKKDATMGICSSKTELACSGFWMTEVRDSRCQ